MTDVGDNKMSSIGDMLDKYKIEDEKNKYVSREFQQYGLELAEELGDTKHKSLFIKLAKTTDRAILESARRFVKDAPNVKSPGKLFMWKVKQLKSGDKK